ncbi:HTH-type transcriptional activator RhaR [Salmonella enterica]
MANQLILLKKDFFTDEQQAVTVADRYPQDVFAEHTHEFCELVMVWRGNGLHVLNDRPYRITRGDLFYIRAEDKHSYTSVNDLVLQNIIYCPERLKLNVNWQAMIPGFQGAQWHPHWRLGSMGMNQARQVINQLEHENNGRDPLANEMAELLFGQLVMTLKRHRYATDDLPATSRETLLDKLITALLIALSVPLRWMRFASRNNAANGCCGSSFAPKPG